MLIAQEKRRSNIAEYIIYMWQIEDIIRSFALDIHFINKSIVEQYQEPDVVKVQIKNWYEVLISQLRKEGKETKGHLNLVEEELKKLEKFHSSLITVYQDKIYEVLRENARDNIQDFARKAKMEGASEVRICLNGLYTIFLLKLKKKEISKETQDAMDTFAQMMAHLAKKFKAFEAGKIQLPRSKRN